MWYPDLICKIVDTATTQMVACHISASDKAKAMARLIAFFFVRAQDRLDKTSASLYSLSGFCFRRSSLNLSRPIVATECMHQCVQDLQTFSVHEHLDTFLDIHRGISFGVPLTTVQGGHNHLNVHAWSNSAEVETFSEAG
ncbi:hypothetical protein PoB_000523100 [Plakobranchus ocellatus]|uniref:Uncharacterized protein n=1 Tax=Plakobranchus ocellatus TaxID=259542 RepID=A0AAV3XUL2_9GAST|nr:hypothetical protein PoB_000523100 [Plakobranchus ocellatus]